mgnify:CR=1 FL=1
MSSPDSPHVPAAGVGTGLASWRAGAGLFLISAAVLALQVLQTRLLSVQMWHHHSYMVVTMTLLGFAAAGSLATVWPALVRPPVATKLSITATLFAFTTLGGYLILGATADRAAELTASGHYWALGVFYSYLLVPYFFGGLAVTIALSAARSVPRLYFWNLMGSALGAWLFIALIAPLGGERLLVFCAALGPLAGLFFARAESTADLAPGRARPKAGLICAVLGLLVCALTFADAPRWFKVGVASTKAMVDTLKHVPGAEHVGQRWSPMCRLDLVRKGDEILIYQDGDAITVMHSDASWAGLAPWVALNTLGYEVQDIRRAAGAPPIDALAIGIGGGIDLRYAMQRGARSVLGIEINPETVKLVGETWREFNGDVYHQPGVQVVVGEGRSTLRRIERTYDHIQLSGTDTYTAGNAGAYVLSESYLYTMEALEEYFERLDPNHGTLGMIRLGYDPPRENLRLFGMALAVLRDEFGVANPSQHAAIIGHAHPYERTGEMVRFTGSVFSRQPIPDQAKAYFEQAGEVEGYSPLYVPGVTPADSPFARLAAAIDAGTEDAFYADYRWTIEPVTDDSPFFFNFHHWRDIFDKSSRNVRNWEDLTGGPIGLRILFALLVQGSLLVAVLVLLPLLVLRREGLKAPNAARHLVYFLSLGAGFMFLEISTIQRLVLYLGHPTYSLTVVLFCFLFFAGLGSLFAARLSARPTRGLRIAIICLCIGIAILLLVLQPILDATLSLPLAARIAITAAVLAPVNFAMGMPFPLGLERLKRLAPRLVPWALAVNGGASVVASILCIVIAMETGFQAVAMLSLGIYALAALVATTGPLAAAKTGG